MTLVVGDEELLVARAIARVVAAACAREGGDVPVHDLDAADIGVHDLAELTSPSLFGDTRVVVVRSVQDASKELTAALVAAVADGEGDVDLVLVHAGGVKGKAGL